MQIKNRLRGENVNLSLPSQRVDRFDEDIANIVSSGKKSALTFAPEAGTQRLRDIVNKGLTSEELLRGIKNAWDQGWRRVRGPPPVPVPQCWSRAAFPQRRAFGRSLSSARSNASRSHALLARGLRLVAKCAVDTSASVADSCYPGDKIIPHRCTLCTPVSARPEGL